MAIEFGHSTYVYKQIEHALLKEDENDDNDDWQREQDNDEEFDYLDAQINKTEKIKQSVRDKSLIKKSQSQNLKQQQQEKDEKEYLLKEQYKLKQKKIQERKEKKEEERKMLLAYQQKAQQQKLEELKSLEDLDLNNKKNNKNIDECEWEDLY